MAKATLIYHTKKKKEERKKKNEGKIKKGLYKLKKSAGYSKKIQNLRSKLI